MKKIMRVLSLVLVLGISVSMLCMGASAVKSSNIWQIKYNDPNGSFLLQDNATGDVFGTVIHSENITRGKEVLTVTSPSYLFTDAGVLELRGAMHFFPKPNSTGDLSAYAGQSINNGVDSIVIPGNAGRPYYNIVFAYADHTHNLGKHPHWVYDNNNHWMVCEECGAFVGMNWHHDVDNDGVCDQCNQPIHYRYVTVKDVPGGKVEVSREKCMLGNRVSITVTPDAGYKLQEIHGVNDNAKNSPRPCFKTRNANEFFMFVDVWDIELQATFVKA